MTKERCSGPLTRWGKVPAWWLLHDLVDADRFAVLAALATYADDGGLCDPSQATLARRLKRSRPWVNRVIAQLAEDGFLAKTVRTRRNGGTTSCLYRLRLDPADVGVTGTAGSVTESDTPCHHSDRNQPDSEQIQEHPPATRANRIGTNDLDREPVAEVPRDWRPSAREVSEALKFYPDADLDAHTAHFVARCRAKGYRYAFASLGDAWLAWFLEDRRRGARGHGSPGPVMRTPHAYSPALQADERLAAWATAATPRQPWA